MSEFIISAHATCRQSPIDASLCTQDSQVVVEDKTQTTRVGVRGVAAESFFKRQGIIVPDQPNQAKCSENGLIVLRLSRTEFWLIDVAQSHQAVLEALELQALSEEGVYRLYCQHSHALFELKGEHSAEMFAKLCGVDLSHDAFAAQSIAQTSVARVNAIVVNTSLSAQRSDNYLILSDVSSAAHLWDALLDASQEF